MLFKWLDFKITNRCNNHLLRSEARSPHAIETGYAGAGAYIELPDNDNIIRLKWYLGQDGNNQTEFSALVHALRYIRKHYPDRRKIAIFSDSQSMVQGVNQESRIKKDLFIQYRNLIQDLLNSFERFHLQHIMGFRNPEADLLSRQAIDEGIAGTLPEDRILKTNPYEFLE